MKFKTYRDMASFSLNHDLDETSQLLHEMLKPFDDTKEQIKTGLTDALGGRGYICTLEDDQNMILGLCTILKTGMSAYIPENFLLYVAIDPSQRGKGLGRQLLDEAFQQCDGDIKLHVEHDNPAQRLYERMGFTSKYREMRLTRSYEG